MDSLDSAAFGLETGAKAFPEEVHLLLRCLLLRRLLLRRLLLRRLGFLGLGGGLLLAAFRAAFHHAQRGTDRRALAGIVAGDLADHGARSRTAVCARTGPPNARQIAAVGNACIRFIGSLR